MTDVFATITGNQNLFVLAPSPGAESRWAGALIAEACLRGRPPFVAVLTDGSSAGDADEQERRTRIAAAALGVPADWLRMFGVPDGLARPQGAVFDAVVASVVLLTWRYDCTLLVVPHDDAVCTAAAEAVAARTGLGHLLYAAATDGTLGAPRAWAARQAAVAIYSG